MKKVSWVLSIFLGSNPAPGVLGPQKQEKYRCYGRFTFASRSFTENFESIGPKLQPVDL